MEYLQGCKVDIQYVASIKLKNEFLLLIALISCMKKPAVLKIVFSALAISSMTGCIKMNRQSLSNDRSLKKMTNNIYTERSYLSRSKSAPHVNLLRLNYLENEK
jgi:hypothetical protein